MNLPISRRSALKSLACGFGSLALADMFSDADNGLAMRLAALLRKPN